MRPEVLSTAAAGAAGRTAEAERVCRDVDEMLRAARAEAAAEFSGGSSAAAAGRPSRPSLDRGRRSAPGWRSWLWRFGDWVSGYARWIGGG